MVVEWMIFFITPIFKLLHLQQTNKEPNLYNMKNKLLILMSGVAVLGITSCTKPAYQQPDAPIQEVPFTQVHINDGFLVARIVNKPYGFYSFRFQGNVRRTAVSITLLLQAVLKKGNIVVIFFF